jgi:O-methyltransferase
MSSKLAKSILKKFTPLFKNTAFFMQGQMDINPRSRWHNADFAQQTGGFYPRQDADGRRIHDLEPWDCTRRDMLVLFLRTIVEQQVDGDMAEVGVYKGNTARLIHHYLPEKPLHLFDTFEGFTERSVTTEQAHTSFATKGHKFSDTSLEGVKRFIDAQNGNVAFYKGYFPDSLPSELSARSFAFVSLDADLYEPTFEGLKFFYPRMSTHGIIVVHDYNAWIGARTAVDEFFADKPEMPVPMPDKSGSALIVRQQAG